MFSQHMPKRPVRKSARILTRTLRYRRNRLLPRITQPRTAFGFTRVFTPLAHALVRANKIVEARRVSCWLLDHDEFHLYTRDLVLPSWPRFPR